MKNLNVNPQGLRDHSRAVDDVVGGVSSARKASGATLSSGAFGIMCQFFLPPLTIVKIVADAAIEAVGESLEEAAAGLRAAADDFESSDAEQAAHIRTVETGLA